MLAKFGIYELEDFVLEFFIVFPVGGVGPVVEMSVYFLSDAYIFFFSLLSLEVWYPLYIH